MSSDTPLRTRGLHHVALFVTNFDATVDFYTRVLGMRVEWHPDADNIYLTQGSDNLALHRANATSLAPQQRLDHIGFILDTPEDVDRWYERLLHERIEIIAPPKTHRDGARSLYCKDPDGATVQLIYHPPLANGKPTNS